MNIIITMAGEGSRFANAGYTVPKYKVEVCNHTLFYWAISSLNKFMISENLFIFIAREEDRSIKFIKDECNELGVINYKTLELNATTDGQATTALHALKAIPNIDDPIAIYNIDTYVEPGYIKPGSIRGHGWIPCFPGKGSHWSFVRIDPDGRALEIREKERISSNATIGFYWFESFRLYERAYAKYYSSLEYVEYGEKYIAPIYNQLVKDDLKVFIHEIPITVVHGLGTPEDVNIFANRFGEI